MRQHVAPLVTITLSLFDPMSARLLEDGKWIAVGCCHGKGQVHGLPSPICFCILKVKDGVGTVLSVNPRLDAANRREQAARLREELAQLESLDQSSANVPPARTLRSFS